MKDQSAFTQKAKSLVDKAFGENPASLDEARSILITLIASELKDLWKRWDEALSANQSLMADGTEAVNTARKAGVEIPEKTTLTFIVQQLVEQIKTPKSAMSVVHHHHHWHTPTKVEQVGDVLTAIPANPEPSKHEVNELVLKVTEGGQSALTDKLVAFLESDKFTTAVKKLRGADV